MSQQDHTEALLSTCRVFRFTSKFLPSLFTHHPLPTSHPSLPAPIQPSCGLTSMFILDLFSHTVLCQLPWTLLESDFWCQDSLGLISLSMGTAVRKAGWLHTSPYHKTLLGARTLPYLSCGAGADCHYIKAVIPALTVPCWPTLPDSSLSPSSAPVLHSRHGTVVMKTTGHMKAAP